MRSSLGLLLLVSINASASLILTIDDPNLVAPPGGHAIYTGILDNTDTADYNVLFFPTLNPPTDASGPPTMDQIFPIAQPAVPFPLPSGAHFAGIVLDITVPSDAQLRSHPFSVEAAMAEHGADGNSIVSNTVFLDLTVAVPEPAPYWYFLGGVGLCLAARRFR